MLVKPPPLKAGSVVTKDTIVEKVGKYQNDIAY